MSVETHNAVSNNWNNQLKPQRSSAHGGKRIWPRYLDSRLLLIAALPWAILRLDSSWLFAYSTSSFGFIDPFIYFGYFLDLTQHLRSFKGAYFSTRLTWTVPGAIVYHFFSPLHAAYVLHLALFYLATLSLYIILRITVSRRAALVAAILMGCHSYFLRSIGWDYMDGAGLTYLLMTLGALTLAARAPDPRWRLVVAGITAAFAVHCQLFVIVFSPLALGYYLFARKEFGLPSVPGWRPFMWGLLGTTAAFGAFNMAVNGRFVFFINAMGMAAKLVIRNPYTDHKYHWLAQATWLVLPILSLLGAILCLRRRKDLLTLPNAELLLFWQRYLVLSVAMMVVWQVIGEPVLQLSYYASYLIPAIFLALGSQFAIVLEGWSRGQFIMLCASVLFLSLLPFALPLRSSFLPMLMRHPWWPSLLLGSLGVVLISRQAGRAAAIGVLCVCAGLASLSAASSTRTWALTGQADDASIQKYAFLTLADSVRTIQQLEPKGNVYFWYDYEGRFGRLFRSVASTYLWSYRMQSESFPALGGKLPPPGRRILILSTDPSTALSRAQSSLETIGMRARLLETRTLQEGPYTWHMTEIEVIPENAGQTKESRTK
jgi:hypothetical protein